MKAIFFHYGRARRRFSYTANSHRGGTDCTQCADLRLVGYATSGERKVLGSAGLRAGTVGSRRKTRVAAGENEATRRGALRPCGGSTSIDALSEKQWRPVMPPARHAVAAPTVSTHESIHYGTGPFKPRPPAKSRKFLLTKFCVVLTLLGFSSSF